MQNKLKQIVNLYKKLLDNLQILQNKPIAKQALIKTRL